MRSAIVSRSDCCVVWDISWISPSGRKGVGLRKGKGDDVCVGGGGGGGVKGHCSVSLACVEGRWIVKSLWRKTLVIKASQVFTAVIKFDIWS